MLDSGWGTQGLPVNLVGSTHSEYTVSTYSEYYTQVAAAL